jgi:sialic acid synthase SpsE
MVQKVFKIWEDLIGHSQAPLFLPDIGTFFNQDMTQAAQLAKRLSNAGVSVVKGEILHSADICLKVAGNEKYWGRKSKDIIEEDYYSLILRKVVSLKAYEELFSYCHELGMQVVTSVYDFEGANFANSVGVAALKVASSNITHQPLIEHMAGIGLPLIIDTGHSTLEEAARAVNWAQDAGAKHLVIEHSALGDGIRHLTRNRKKYISRMGLVAKRDLKPGDKIDIQSVRFSFPAIGIGTEYWDDIKGWEVIESVDAGEVIGWQHIRALVT